MKKPVIKQQVTTTLDIWVVKKLEARILLSHRSRSNEINRILRRTLRDDPDISEE